MEEESGKPWRNICDLKEEGGDANENGPEW